MQIGIDLGATKIEYVLLDANNKELERDRTETPKNFIDTINSITKIVQNLEKKYNSKFIIGICHPGNLDSTTGRIKNAHKANKAFTSCYKSKLNMNVLSVLKDEGYIRIIGNDIDLNTEIYLFKFNQL